MNICIVNTFFPPHVSGTARASFLLARTLSEGGHTVTVITSSIRGTPKKEIDNGVAVYRLRSFMYPKLGILHKADLYCDILPGNLLQIFSILRNEKIELVQIFGQFFDLTFLSVLAAKALRLPVVLTIGTRMMHSNLAYKTIFQLFDRTVVSHIVARRADRVIVMDRIMRDYIASRYALGASMRFITAGVDVERFGHASGALVRRTYGLDERDPIVLSLGNLSNFRRIESLAKALPTVLKEIPHLKILVVGAAYDNSQADLVRKLGLEKSVIFCGTVDYALTPSYFAASSVVANELEPDLYLRFNSGIGISLASLEAMASGRAVLTAATEDNFPNRTLTNWQNIVLVRPGNVQEISDALLRLLSDQMLRETIGRNAQKFMREHFSVQTISENYEAVYKELLGNYQSRKQS
jgi:glycosyltransferase involved in cell wall biosynthesis